MSKILVVGSLHYDIMVDAHHRPEKGETVIGTKCSYKFGGKGGNQAIASAKCGVDVRFFGAVGNDDHGKYLLKILRDNAIDIDYVQTINNIPSGMSVATTDAEGDYGAVVVSNANTMIDVDLLCVDALWKDVSMLILQNEVPEIVNIRAAAEAKLRKIPVCINAAPAKVISSELFSLIDLLVVNGVEARDMCGISVNSLDNALSAAHKLHNDYSKVVVTAGEYGVAYVDECISGSIPAEKIELVSTHGAGDCFMGVLCQALIKKHSLQDAVKMANHAAALHVSQKAN